MYAFPRPALTPFQVTLLPDQVEDGSAASSSAAAAAAGSHAFRLLEAVRTQNWNATTAMAHHILELAGNYTRPQAPYAEYSPEKVMRSVRAIVDDDRCRDLVEFLKKAVHQYMETHVEDIAKQWTQASAVQTSTRTETEGGNETASGAEEAQKERGNDAIATLDAVRTLALLVTHYERLHRGIAELSSVWAYANEWCAVQASREVPHSLRALSIQESSDVLHGATEVINRSLAGYLAVLEAELQADTDALFASICAASASSARESTSSTAAAAAGNSDTVDVNLIDLDTPPSAAAAQTDAATLELLARPPSLAALTSPLRRRLLAVFTRLTRATQQYNMMVEPAVVRLVQAHYERVAHQLWAAELNATRFFSFADKALKHAATVHQQYLHSGTIPLVEDAIQTTLIGGVGTEVLKRDFTALMEQEQFRTVRLAWRLLSASAHVRSAPAVVELLREYLLECGQGIMEELVPGSAKATPAGLLAPPRERPFLAARHLIGLLEQGSHTVEKCFYECEKEFKVALHEALQTILEAYPNAFSEQLAAYQDAIMKEVEVGHVPVSLAAAPRKATSGAATGEDHRGERHLEDEQQHGATRAAGEASDGLLSNEEEDGASPLRRPRGERSPQATATATVADSSERHDAALGSAALRHAAPLPSEAKEATPVLRRIAYIYSYHPKKELFEAAYWRDFARRCLHPHRKVDVAAENAFICYLRDICGLSFTSKFEGMLTDLDASSQLTSQLKTWMQEQEQAPSPDRHADEEETPRTKAGPDGAAISQHAVEAHLLILAQSFWPKYPALPPKLYVPSVLQRTVGSVEQFYAGLFPNRHLAWQHPLSNAVLRTQLTPPSAAFSLTGTYAQCILLMRLDALYDKGVPAITTKALCAEVGLDCTSTEVQWSLQGLCHPRFRLVLREGNATTPGGAVVGAEAAADDDNDNDAKKLTSAAGAAAATVTLPTQLSPSDLLRLNLGFAPASAKVRIPLQTRARTAATAGVDGSGRGARTADNGGHLVEVAIVSCLKARRTITHADLVAAVNERLPFVASIPVLKKSIDKMIERGFMVRGKDNTYQFSA